MKKITQLSLFLVFLFFVQTSYAQKYKMPKWDISFGIGALPTFAKDGGNINVLPLSVSGDFLGKRMLVGAFAGYSSTETRRDITGDGNSMLCKNRFSVLGLRFGAHTGDRFEKWTAYGGFTVGINTSRVDVLEGDVEWLKTHKDYQPVQRNFAMSGFVGGRYAVGDNLGVFGELGFGISLVKLGVSYRF